MQSAGPRATAWLTACCSKLFNLTMVRGIHGCVVDVSSGILRIRGMVCQECVAKIGDWGDGQTCGL